MARGSIVWDQGQCEIFGVDPSTFVPTLESIQPLINPEDFELLDRSFRKITKTTNTFQTEFRVLRPNGDVRWCTGTAAASFDEMGRPIWLSGVTSDITERKRAEERQILLAEEVDHRARNVVAVVQSIMRLTRADSIDDYIGALDGRIGALSNAHRLLAGSRWEGADLTRLVEEEFAPYRASGNERVKSRGPNVLLPPATAQTIALALHELATNAAKYGALSVDPGYVELTWQTEPGKLELVWTEFGRTSDRPTRPSRLWKPGYCRRHRTAARRSRELRLAGERTAMHPVRAARRHFGSIETQRIQDAPRCSVASGVRCRRQTGTSCRRRAASLDDAGGYALSFRTQG